MRKKIKVKVENPQYSVITGITFAQVDNWFGHTRKDLKMDIIYPEDNTKAYPCIVWVCGGAWRTMDRSAHLAYLSILAMEGFVVASVEYRTTNEVCYPLPLLDVKGGIRYLKAHAEPGVTLRQWRPLCMIRLMTQELFWMRQAPLRRLLPGILLRM